MKEVKISDLNNSNILQKIIFTSNPNCVEGEAMFKVLVHVV